MSNKTTYSTVGQPIEIGAEVFSKQFMPVVRAAQVQAKATPQQITQLYCGFLMACTGSLAADIGHERAIQVAQMAVDAFAAADLEAPTSKH